MSGLGGIHLVSCTLDTSARYIIMRGPETCVLHTDGSYSTNKTIMGVFENAAAELDEIRLIMDTNMDQTSA